MTQLAISPMKPQCSGVCRARHNGPKRKPSIRIILVDRDTGEPI
jgi:hypothetical protein